MIEINIEKEFESQDVKTSYELDFNKTNIYRIAFKDGYYVTISDTITHNDNDDNIEACLFSIDNEKLSVNWPNSRIDEVPYRLYNWFMNLEKIGDNKFNLIFERGIPMAGGFF